MINFASCLSLVIVIFAFRSFKMFSLIIARRGGATPNCCFQSLKFYSVANSCWLSPKENESTGQVFFGLCRFIAVSLWTLDRCWKEVNQREDAQTSRYREAGRITSHRRTRWQAERSLEIKKKNKTVGCVETHRERWTQRNNKHGQKTEDASAAAQFCCSSELRWVCFWSFWDTSDPWEWI